MQDPVALSLASNLKRMREARAWSQQQLADCSGVPRPTIANLESGEGNPTLNVMLRVAAALGATLEQLIASTQSRLEVREADRLPCRSLGPVLATQIHSDATGCEIERCQLPPKTECEIRLGRNGLRQVISCELGRIEVRAMGESVKLRSGDTVRFRGEGLVELENLGAKVALVLLVTMPSPFATQ